MAFTEPELLDAWTRINGDGAPGSLADLIIQAAVRHDIAPEVFVALCNEETNDTDELGDGGHGVGPCQIDDRSWEIAQVAKATGLCWTDPAPLLDCGANLLARNKSQAKGRYPLLAADLILRIALSGYNCGMGNAFAGHEAGDCDKYTANGHYGEEILAKAEVFRPWVLAHIAHHSELLEVTGAPAPYPGMTSNYV